MIFENREEAAKILAARLDRYRGKNPLILAIPRGALPLARILAERLEGELDVVLVHKIGAPGNQEFAIGSVSEFGNVTPSPAVETYGIPQETVEKSAASELKRLAERRKTYSPIRPPISARGRIVIIADDGIATGATMLAAVHALRAQGAARIVVAAPVGAPRSFELFKNEADETLILDTPEDFFSVSQFYEEFPQVSDEEAIAILAESQKSSAEILRKKSA